MPTFEQTWLPFLYMYGVGGIFFIAGMIIIRKSNALNLEKKRHRCWNKIILFGFIYFMVIHFILIIAALYW